VDQSGSTGSGYVFPAEVVNVGDGRYQSFEHGRWVYRFAENDACHGPKAELHEIGTFLASHLGNTSINPRPVIFERNMQYFAQIMSPTLKIEDRQMRVNDVLSSSTRLLK